MRCGRRTKRKMIVPDPADCRLKENESVETTVHPVGTQVRRECGDDMDQPKALTEVVHDFKEPYRRVRCPDGDWEELNRRQLNKGKKQRTDTLSGSST